MICGAYFHISEAPFFSLNICDILYMFLPKHLVWDLGWLQFQANKSVRRSGGSQPDQTPATMSEHLVFVIWCRSSEKYTLTMIRNYKKCYHLSGSMIIGKT